MPLWRGPKTLRQFFAAFGSKFRVCKDFGKPENRSNWTKGIGERGAYRIKGRRVGDSGAEQLTGSKTCRKGERAIRQGQICWY